MRTREASVAVALAALCVLLALTRPDYFSRGNLLELFLANLPVLMVAG